MHGKLRPRVSRRSASRGRSDESTVYAKKSKSLSPKPRWCPPPARTTKSAINPNARNSSQIDVIISVRKSQKIYF